MSQGACICENYQPDTTVQVFALQARFRASSVPDARELESAAEGERVTMPTSISELFLRARV